MAVSDKQSQQSQELATRLWAIANDLRGNMDAAKFKDYILGIIFYRYLSERTEGYMDNLLKNDGITYKEALNDEEYAPVVKGWAIEHLGYVIEPQYLFSSFVEAIKAKEFSIEHFEEAISKLTASTLGEESEAAFDKLFDDMNLQDKDLGKEVKDRTNLISKVINNIADISFDINDEHVDILGTAYMILIGLFASDAGKKAGEFFSASCACDLVAKLATVGLETVDSACDCCSGSGSMLLEVQNNVPSHNVTHFYAQEKNGSTYNLLRMNLLMHGVPYKKFTVFNDDTLTTDNFEDKLFTVQVSNPPYSVKNTADSKEFLDDPRYSGAGVLAPSNKADMAFLEHIAYHMADNGRAVVLLPHGVLFRGGAELAIRKYLIDNMNCIDAIIGLPAKMFITTSIAVVAIVLKKNRNGNSDNIIFIDASSKFVANKTQNVMSEENISDIVAAYKERKDIEKFAKVVSMDEIKANDYNLNIPRYVDTFEKEAEIDLEAVFADIKKQEEEKAALKQTLNKYFEELGLAVKL